VLRQSIIQILKWKIRIRSMIGGNDINLSLQEKKIL